MSYTREIELSEGQDLHIEQNTVGAEGCVVWDSALVLTSYLQKKKDTQAAALVYESALDLGSGTGVVGLALLKMGIARNVTLSDRASQIELIRRNIDINCSIEQAASNVRVQSLTWDCEEELSRMESEGAFDLITASDCVYGDKSSASLAALLSRLIASNPKVTILISFEARARHRVEVDSGADYSREFFQLLTHEYGCTVDKVAEGEHGTFHAPEISIYVVSKAAKEDMRAAEGAAAAVTKGSVVSPLPARAQHLQAQRDGSRCACGCVPNVASLFEMAQKRAEHRAKQKLAAESSEGAKA